MDGPIIVLIDWTAVLQWLQLCDRTTAWPYRPITCVISCQVDFEKAGHTYGKLVPEQKGKSRDTQLIIHMYVYKYMMNHVSIALPSKRR